MSEEQNLKFDLNNNDDVIKFMNLEFLKKLMKAINIIFLLLKEGKISI